VDHAETGRIIIRGPQIGAPEPDPAAATHPVSRELLVLACFLAAGIVATWPRITYLSGRVPAKSDEGSYVWDLWWMAHQAVHAGYPWFTHAMAAPVGANLGFHALMPLAGLLMTPVTLAFGPVFSFNLLCVAVVGLLCYAMYRAARLWVPSQFGALAAGAFFGLSANLTWRAWYHLNIALGALFLPLALEAAIRLERSPGRRQAVLLGITLGASALVDQTMTVLAAILTCAVLLPWLIREPSAGKLAAAAIAGVVGLAVASPQLVAMVRQVLAGAAPLTSPVHSFIAYAAGLPQLFGPSPRVAAFGLDRLGAIYYRGHTGEGLPTFGAVLTSLTILGVVVSWHRRGARLVALGWLGCAVLALGPVLWIGSTKYVPLAQTWHGFRLSLIMPYTWFVRIPGLGNLREADRFTLLGMVPAALLAGSAVAWLRRRAWPLLVGVLVLGPLEAGWSGDLAITPAAQRAPVAPISFTALDRPIAADHSKSIVADVPFGLWGGTGLYGTWLPAQVLALATEDGHPRAVAYLSRVPAPVAKAIRAHPFYARLVHSQYGTPSTAAEVAAARADARRMGVGWVLLWQPDPTVTRYLSETGFTFDYRADGVSVYRPTDPARPPN
jgi:hypothetical protein